MKTYICYLEDGIVLDNPREAKELKRNVYRFTTVDGYLFKYAYSRLVLKCITPM